MKKAMTHTVILTTREGGFTARYVDKRVECRLLTNHIVLEHGTKYRKSDGDMVGAHKYMGQYMEDTRVKPTTLIEVKETGEK